MTSQLYWYWVTGFIRCVCSVSCCIVRVTYLWFTSDHGAVISYALLIRALPSPLPPPPPPRTHPLINLIALPRTTHSRHLDCCGHVVLFLNELTPTACGQAVLPPLRARTTSTIKPLFVDAKCARTQHDYLYRCQLPPSEVSHGLRQY